MRRRIGGWGLVALGLGGLGAAGLAYRPPLGAWIGWVARRHQVPEGLVVAVVHAETRGRASARTVEHTARRLEALRPVDSGACAWAPALSALRYPREPLAGLLFADEALRGWAQGERGRDGLGLAYGARRPEAACALALPGSEPAERVGASFARFWAAAPSARRAAPGRQVKAIVLHTAEGTFASAVAWFRRPEARTSAHYVLRASDGLVAQMVDEREVAFHDACFNDETVGVEHEGFSADGERWYSDALYRASARLVRDIAERHGVPLDGAHVLGHDRAPDCSEHEDPGPGWDWGRFWRGVAEAEGRAQRESGPGGPRGD